MSLYEPLRWPTSARSNDGDRIPSRYRVSLEDAIVDLMNELVRRGATCVRITSNLKLTKDGTRPVKGQPEPTDPSVAVYFKSADGVQRVLVGDLPPPVRENLRLVWKVLRQAPHWPGWPHRENPRDHGSRPLAAVPFSRSWREVLGFTMKLATPEDLRKARRTLLAANHPDRGGSSEAFREIQTAFEDAMQEVAG